MMTPARIAILSMVSALLFTAACSYDAYTPESSAAPEDTVAALVARAGAPLFDGMGSHHHKITTVDINAQRYFDQGLVIDFAFNHAESVRSFQAERVTRNL